MSDLTLLEDISLNQIKDYLIKEEWIIDSEYKNKNLVVFNKENYTITIPSQENFKDYKVRLYEAIKTLSYLNNQGFQDIIKEIKTVQYDKLSFRIIGDIVEDGKIPLSYASKYVHALYNLIVAAGSNEEDPKPYFQRLPNDKFSQNFKFAQTEVGSFIFNIETVKLDPTNNPNIVDEDGTIKTDVPIERKIVKRVVNGLRQIEKDTSINLEQIYDNGYKSGLNANMCDAILELKEITTDVEIESTVKLARIFENDEMIEERIVLNNRSFNMAESISKAYKERPEIEPIKITGQVFEVTVDKFDNTTGDVTIEVTYDKKSRNIRTHLDGVNFRNACDALKDRFDISIEGTLNKSKSRWTIDNVKKFKVLK
ncbi:hypothetical protein DSECCO2_461970 [anaerobic digester metagenome]